MNFCSPLYDPDGDRITEYEWTQVDSTGINATLVNANTESPVFVAPQVTGDKEFEFELRVRDSGTGDFGLADRISVLVQDSDPPVPPVGAACPFTACQDAANAGRFFRKSALRAERPPCPGLIHAGSPPVRLPAEPAGENQIRESLVSFISQKCCAPLWQ